MSLTPDRGSCSPASLILLVVWVSLSFDEVSRTQEKSNSKFRHQTTNRKSFKIGSPQFEKRKLSRVFSYAIAPSSSLAPLFELLHKRQSVSGVASTSTSPHVRALAILHAMPEKASGFRKRPPASPARKMSTQKLLPLNLRQRKSVARPATPCAPTSLRRACFKHLRRIDVCASCC